jgi:Protein of unknown function (DUF4019)
LISLLLSAAVRVPAQPTPEKLAQTSRDAWLAIVDSGKYAESSDAAAQSFKAAVPKDQWQSRLGQTCGTPRQDTVAQVKTASNTKTLPGAPAGEYVVIQYDSNFEHQQAAIETLIPTLDGDGQGRVSGYFIP